MAVPIRVRNMIRVRVRVVALSPLGITPVQYRMQRCEAKLVRLICT